MPSVVDSESESHENLAAVVWRCYMVVAPVMQHGRQICLEDRSEDWPCRRCA
jgi:hypothetical protein